MERNTIFMLGLVPVCLLAGALAFIIGDVLVSVIIGALLGAAWALVAEDIV